MSMISDFIIATEDLEKALIEQNVPKNTEVLELKDVDTLKLECLYNICIGEAPYKEVAFNLSPMENCNEEG